MVMLNPWMEVITVVTDRLLVPVKNIYSLSKITNFMATITSNPSGLKAEWKTKERGERVVLVWSRGRAATVPTTALDGPRLQAHARSFTGGTAAGTRR